MTGWLIGRGFDDWLTTEPQWHAPPEPDEPEDFDERRDAE